MGHSRSISTWCMDRRGCPSNATLEEDELGLSEMGEASAWPWWCRWLFDSVISIWSTPVSMSSGWSSRRLNGRLGIVIVTVWMVVFVGKMLRKGILRARYRSGGDQKLFLSPPENYVKGRGGEDCMCIWRGREKRPSWWMGIEAQVWCETKGKIRWWTLFFLFFSLSCFQELLVEEKGLMMMSMLLLGRKEKSQDEKGKGRKKKKETVRCKVRVAARQRTRSRTKKKRGYHLLIVPEHWSFN